MREQSPRFRRAGTPGSGSLPSAVTELLRSPRGGGLTEAAGSGGVPEAEATTDADTACGVNGRRPSAWSGAQAAAQDQLLRGRGSLPPAAAVQKERPPVSGPGELWSLLSPLPLAWLAGPGGRGEGVGLSVLRGNLGKGGAGSGWSVSASPPDCGESGLKLIPRLAGPLFNQVPLSPFLPELKYQGGGDRAGDWRR